MRICLFKFFLVKDHAFKDYLKIEFHSIWDTAIAEKLLSGERRQEKRASRLYRLHIGQHDSSLEEAEIIRF